MAFRSLYRAPSHVLPHPSARSRRPASPSPAARPQSTPVAACSPMTIAPAATPAAGSQSLLFQLEIDGRDVLRPTLQQPRRDLHAVLERLDALARPETSFEARLARDARYYYATTLEEDGRADVVILASRLAGVGYDVTLRNAIGGGSGVSAFKHLSHEFLVVAGPHGGSSAFAGAEFIVDPSFREQFRIPQTVGWYDGLLVRVPEAYVGPPARLRALVRLLGGEMAAAFAAAGAATPPWRTPGSLLSKWLPAKARDEHVSSGSSGGCSPVAGARSFPAAALSAPPLTGAASGGNGFDDPRPSFAAAGQDLRTTSAPAVAAPATAPVAPLAVAPPSALLRVAARLPEGRSDSEPEDQMSSPDTTLAWTLPGGRRTAGGQPKAPMPAGPEAAATGIEAQQLLSPVPRRLPRTIPREALASGTGGRSPPRSTPTAADAAVAPAGTSPRAAAAKHQPPRLPILRPAPGTQLPATATPPPPTPWLATSQQYAAHPQALASRRLTAAAAAPYAAAAPSQRATPPGSTSSSGGSGSEDEAQQQQGQPLRRRSFSALSSKLASAGLGGRLAETASQQAPQPQQHKPQAQQPQQQPQQQGQRPQQPSVHAAPFWEQPLIVDYIAAQRPAPGNTGGGGTAAPAPAAVAALLPGEVRIRTVKMRGGNGNAAGGNSGGVQLGLRPRVRA